MGYQLYAHELIFRVIEVLWTTETEDGKERIVPGRVDHRRTYKGAAALRDRWIKDRGRYIKGAIVQGGIITWYPDDELQSAYDATDFTRTQNYDDRDEE